MIILIIIIFIVINSTQKIGISQYFEYLYRIRSKPIQYSFPRENISIKKTIYEPFKDPFIIESNKKHKLKIYSILDEPPLPKLNYVYLDVRERLKNNKEIYKKIAERDLSVENSKYKENIFNQNSRIEEIRKYKKLPIHIVKKALKTMRNSKTKEFQVDYKKYFGKKKDLRLPDINNNKNTKYEKLFQTEINTNSVNEPSIENSEKLKEHKYEEISHQKQGHLNQ
jgi:hypothetical protein